MTVPLCGMQRFVFAFVVSFALCARAEEPHVAEIIAAVSESVAKLKAADPVSATAIGRTEIFCGTSVLSRCQEA